MSKALKTIGLILIGAAVVIQFIPANRPANEPREDYNFFEAYEIPANIEQIIRTSCFDCHSQEVNFPWYASVAPASWLVNRDVRIGRSHLDFSRWFELEKKDKLKLAGEIGEEVESGAMPMPIYVFMHTSAGLDREQRELILQWSELLAEKIFEE